MFKIVVKNGAASAKEFYLSEGVYIVGRSRSKTDFQILEKDVSGVHVKLVVGNSTVVCENLSRFGTLIDGRPMTKKISISDGQVLKLGKITELVLREADSDSEDEKQGDNNTSESVDGLTDEKTLHHNDDIFNQKDTSGYLTGDFPSDSFDLPHSSESKQNETEGVITDQSTIENVKNNKSPSLSDKNNVINQAIKQNSSNNNAKDIPNTGEFSVKTDTFSTGEFKTSGSSAGFNGTETAYLETRLAAPDELLSLQIKEKRRVKISMPIILIIIGILTLGLWFWFGGIEEVENPILWPKDKQGNYLDSLTTGLKGGRVDGEYDIVYPNNGTFGKKVFVDRIIISGYVGRDKDVPLYIIFEEEVNDKFVLMSREKFIEDWKEMMAKKHSWTFDDLYRFTPFIGKKNGIPISILPYYFSDQKGYWYGVAKIIRHGRRRIIIRAETTGDEKVRMRELLAKPYIIPSEEFEYKYWEPSDTVLPSLSLESGITEIRNLLDTEAPGIWNEISENLTGLLSKSVRESDKKSENQLLELLIKLREKQTIWFHSQELKLQSARMNYDKNRQHQIINTTRGIFSNEKDRRFKEVRSSRRWEVQN